MERPGWKEHTFAVCAYQESPYLEECIKSLERQKLKSKICICTSTPNAQIEQIAREHHVPLYVRDGKSDIGEDWNYAIRCTDTPYVTLAHQDDLYEEGYSWQVRKAIRQAKHPLLVFTDYAEVREEKWCKGSILLRIKRWMLIPLRSRAGQRSLWVRRRILSFGNAICCPSVTYVVGNLSDPVFVPGMRSNLDWDAWERFSRFKGEFLYIPKILMAHRIHEASETSAMIREQKREEEDLRILKRFWNPKIAKIIEKYYQKSEKLNEFGEKSEKEGKAKVYHSSKR